MSAVPNMSAEFHQALAKQARQMQNLHNQMEAYHGGHRQTNPQAYGYPVAGANNGAGCFTIENCTFDFSRIKPDPLENAGIRAGEIEAWRCWYTCGKWLKSMAMSDVWVPGETVQAPIPPDDRGPFGIHAWKTLAKAVEYGLGGSTIAVGRVHLWGEVVEHEHGYRAEYAKIISIDYVLNKKWAASALRRRLNARYGAAA